MKHQHTDTTVADLDAAAQEFSDILLDAIKPFEEDSPAHVALFRLYRAAHLYATVAQWRGTALALEAARMTAESRQELPRAGR